MIGCLHAVKGNYFDAKWITTNSTLCLKMTRQLIPGSLELFYYPGIGRAILLTFIM